MIGAGPAGLECAVSLMRAGQKVTVAEAGAEAGGRVTRESRLPGLASWARVRDYRMYQLSQSTDADLYLHSRMTEEDIVEFGADTVTIATSARWRRDGVGSTNSDPKEFGGREILTPDDVMDGREIDGAAARYLVYDDDHYYMASVVAEALAAAGHGVTLITPLPAVSAWTEHTLEQSRIIERLNGLGVQMHPNTALGPDLRFRNTLSGGAIDTANAGIVLVSARTPRHELTDRLKSSFSSAVLHQAGDCLNPGTIQMAVLSGHTAARNILDPGSTFRRDQTSVSRLS